MQEYRKEYGADEQVRGMLADGEPWSSVAKFCSECLQHLALRLKPWEVPPCRLEVDGPSDDPGVRLLKKMLALGVSKFDPDPLAAVEAVERLRATGSAAALSK